MTGGTARRQCLAPDRRQYLHRPVSPHGCTFEATTISNAGEASTVGAGDLVADFRGGDGTLRYIGSGDTSDRLFWAWGNSRLESSGTGPLSLTNTGLVVSQNGTFTHWLGGTNTGDNTLAATLVDSPTPVEFATSWFRWSRKAPACGHSSPTTTRGRTAYSGMTRMFRRRAAAGQRRRHHGRIGGDVLARHNRLVPAQQRDPFRRRR